MQGNDVVLDFLLPVIVMGGGLLAFMAVADGASRLWAWARGEKHEPFINW